MVKLGALLGRSFSSKNIVLVICWFTYYYSGDLFGGGFIHKITGIGKMVFIMPFYSIYSL